MADDTARKLTQRYDLEASAYRELWAPILRVAGQSLLRRLDGAPPRRILDVGTGVGALLPDLRTTSPGAWVLGVDRSAGMLRLAPAEFARAVMDARQLALRSASVDRVLMVFMLFHLDSPATGLREARRVLRPGGRIGTLTWGGDLESPATRIWKDCLDAHGAVPLDPGAEARHEAVDTPDKMEALLRGAGFASARAWTEDLVASIEVDQLLRLRTSMGSSKPRFDSLDPEAQFACVSEARRRMERLAPEDRVARGMVVHAVGVA
jgi:SAM-dependent methyltransferase